MQRVLSTVEGGFLLRCVQGRVAGGGGRGEYLDRGGGGGGVKDNKYGIFSYKVLCEDTPTTSKGNEGH